MDIFNTLNFLYSTLYRSGRHIESHSPAWVTLTGTWRSMTVRIRPTPSDFIIYKIFGTTIPHNFYLPQEADEEDGIKEEDRANGLLICFHVLLAQYLGPI